jgi:hypothetical protein
VVFLKVYRRRIGRHGEVIRSWADIGEGFILRRVFTITKYKNGNEAEEIYDDRGLCSRTSFKLNETAVTRYVRIEAPDDPNAPEISDVPKRTPRLAGPKGHLPQ